MKYRDFAVKINSENNSENTISIFSVCKNGLFSTKNLAKKI